MKEKLRKLTLLLCVCVFLYSAFQLGSIFYNYHVIEKETDKLVETIIDEPEEELQPEKPVNPVERVVDFEKLKDINKDVIGWIYIPGTKVDEPILKGKNNDTYLRTSIYKKHLTAGTIFIDEINNKDFQDDNTIIYGHNMKNGTRFHDVIKYCKQDYLDQHPYVYIYLPDGNIQVYTVIVGDLIDAYSDLYVKDIKNYKQYIQKMTKKAKAKIEVPNEKAPLIMLSTCKEANNTARYIISARLDKIIER